MCLSKKSVNLVGLLHACKHTVRGLQLHFNPTSVPFVRLTKSKDEYAFPICCPNNVRQVISSCCNLVINKTVWNERNEALQWLLWSVHFVWVFFRLCICLSSFPSDNTQAANKHSVSKWKHFNSLRSLCGLKGLKLRDCRFSTEAEAVIFLCSVFRLQNSTSDLMLHHHLGPFWNSESMPVLFCFLTFFDWSLWFFCLISFSSDSKLSHVKFSGLLSVDWWSELVLRSVWGRLHF